MELKEILNKRKSCRKFKNEPANYEMLANVTGSLIRAPYASGGPRRKTFYYSDQETKNKLMSACMDQPYVGECSAVFVFCGTDTEARMRQGDQKYIFDCATACMCADLAAVESGYRTCWIGNFIPEQVQKILDTPFKPCIILLIGMPA